MMDFFLTALAFAVILIVAAWPWGLGARVKVWMAERGINIDLAWGLSLPSFVEASATPTRMIVQTMYGVEINQVFVGAFRIRIVTKPAVEASRIVMPL